jgi:hypothetical protein
MSNIAARRFWTLLFFALVMVASVVVFARCQSPTPTPDCQPCSWIATQEARWLTPSPTGGTGTTTPTLTPQSPTPLPPTRTVTGSSTPTRTPTRTPSATPTLVTPTPYIPDLKIQFLNTAKPSSRLKVVITYSGVISSQVGLWLPDATNLFPGDSAPAPTCGLACWDVGSTATISADIWINSTWRQGQAIAFNLFWQKAVQGPQREYWDEWHTVIVGGGTPWTPTPTQAPTQTKTPAPPSAIITVRTGAWVRIDNPGLATWVYYWSEGPEPVCACVEEGYIDGKVGCIRVEDGCKGLCGRVRVETGNPIDDRWLEDGALYGWHSLQSGHAAQVWLGMEGWGDQGACSFRITRLVGSNQWLGSTAEREGL